MINPSLVMLVQESIEAEDERASAAEAEVAASRQQLHTTRAERDALTDNSRKRRCDGCACACNHTQSGAMLMLFSDLSLQCMKQKKQMTIISPSAFCKIMPCPALVIIICLYMRP